MNCMFCQSDITNYRSPGLVPPAGTFQCMTCAQSNGLKQVVISFNTVSMPLAAIIKVNHLYYFRVDYYENRTFLMGPYKTTECHILQFEGTNVTPKSAKQKMQTYLLFH